MLREPTTAQTPGHPVDGGEREPHRLRHHAGHRHRNALTPGIAIALRRSPDEPWTLCVVRWIRSETPEQIELGLQVIANTAKPVTVGFRGGSKPRPMRPALVMPPIAALGRQQSILAPAGTYSARRFMLVSDIHRLYIAQGRLLSLDMQTPRSSFSSTRSTPTPISQGRPARTRRSAARSIAASSAA
jgi:hypothetical protein